MFNSFCAGQTTESKQVSINLSEQIFLVHYTSSRECPVCWKRSQKCLVCDLRQPLWAKNAAHCPLAGYVVVRRTRYGDLKDFDFCHHLVRILPWDILPSLRRCRIEVRDEMHPCQPGRMKWCRYEVGAARLVTNWCTAKLCIMHIHLPWGDDVMVMVVTETQRPRKSEREKNGNDPCIFQRRVLSTTWCEWGLRMQQSWGPWWSSSRAASRPPPSPRSIVPRLTARNSIPLNAMQCNSIPFNA